MTDGKRPLVSAKDLTRIAAWIGALVLLGALLWFLTQTVRDRMLQNTVNRILERQAVEFRLEARVPFNMLTPRQNRLGTWFSLSNSEKKGLVFTVMNGGVLFPCAAVVTPDGFVEKVVFLAPLLPETSLEGLVNQYILRIERNARPGGLSLRSGE